MAPTTTRTSWLSQEVVGAAILAGVLIGGVQGCHSPKPETKGPPVLDEGLPTPSAAETAEAGTITWSLPVAQGKLIVEQREIAANNCELRCRKTGSGEVRWTVHRCATGAQDLTFASEDCAKLVVLHGNPQVGARGLNDAIVASVFNNGELVQEFQGETFLGDLEQPSGKYFVWIAGVFGRPGEGPAVSRDGSSVVARTVSGREVVIPFEGSSVQIVEAAPKVPPAPTATAPDTRGRAVGMVTYEDEGGTVVVVSSLSEVPEKLRKSAHRVASDEVQVVDRPHDTKPAKGNNLYAMPAVQDPPAKPPAPVDPAPPVNNEPKDQRTPWMKYIMTDRRLDPTVNDNAGRTYSEEKDGVPFTACRPPGDGCSKPTDCCSGNCEAGACK